MVCFVLPGSMQTKGNKMKTFSFRKISYLFFLGLIGLVLYPISCKKKDQEVKNDLYYNGSTKIQVDESFSSLVEALADGYQLNYPQSKVEVIPTKEDQAFVNFLNNKTELVVLSKPVSQNQIDQINKRGLKYQPANFAADALLFIVPRDSPIQAIEYSQIKSKLNSKDHTFIFNGAYSSNLSYLTNFFGISQESAKVATIQNNADIISDLKKYPGKIGVIAQNTLSRPFHPETKLLREQVKVLPVIKDGISISPSPDNVKQMKYPFTRVLYFLEREAGFGVAKGFIRFSCTQKGQLIIEKENMQPFYLFPRQVRLRPE